MHVYKNEVYEIDYYENIIFKSKYLVKIVCYNQLKWMGKNKMIKNNNN